MPHAEKHYRWILELRPPPSALWPLVSDTERFNRDCGFPPFETRPPEPGKAPEPGVKRLRARYLGLVGEWEEREFEWVEPARFGVERIFSRGPVELIATSCNMAPSAAGGTTLTYEVRIKARSLVGAAIIPLAVGFKMRRDTKRVMTAYGEKALKGGRSQGSNPALAVPPLPKVEAIAARLVTEARQSPALVERLSTYVTSADEFSASKMRPFELADNWGSERRQTLDLFLHATRAGMLDLSWEVLCPHCRGSRGGGSDLSSVGSEAHCDSCGIDFTVNFDQSIELTFVPNPAVRRVTRVEHCIGGPQVTPHVVAQKHMRPGESLFIVLSYPDGRYRVRQQAIELQQAFRIERGGAPRVRMEVGVEAAPIDEPAAEPGGVLALSNVGSEPRLVVIERVAWSDQAVTAAAVTSRQIFRDLFSREILRQGERISVGGMTIVFTDLKDSTRLYREIGDAPAFGRVLSHFDTLKAAIADGNGAIVKTMGDAVMAAFSHPVDALLALRRAQAELAAPGGAKHAFALKCSINQGPCLAISQNERLDYFGTTVNVGARLCAVSTGADIVVSDEVMRDAETAALVGAEKMSARRDSATLRGVGTELYGFWRVTG